MTTTDDGVRRYRDRLLYSLRMRDVPGERIGQVLAEVEAHVAETGEDPVEAFGPPQEYAVQVVAVTGRVGRWRLTPRVAVVSLLIALGAFAATSWTMGGLVGLVADSPEGGPFGLGPFQELVLGLVVGAAVMAVLVRHTRREEDPVLDPRTGRVTDQLPGWAPPAAFGAVFVAVVGFGLLVALV